MPHSAAACPRGSIAELTGSGSCGRTTLVLSTLAELTRQGSRCAYVDLCDALDPLSAAALGVELGRLLWVRIAPCPDQRPEQRPSQSAKTTRSPGIRPEHPVRLNQVRLNQALRLSQGLRAADLLLSAGGWGAVVVDMAGIDAAQTRRIPLATWYRFRLQAERSRTLLLVVSSALPAVDERQQGAAQSVPGQQLCRHLPPLPAGRGRLAAYRTRIAAPAGSDALPHPSRTRPRGGVGPANRPAKERRIVSAADLSASSVRASSVHTANKKAAWSSAVLWTG